MRTLFWAFLIVPLLLVLGCAWHAFTPSAILIWTTGGVEPGRSGVLYCRYFTGVDTFVRAFRSDVANATCPRLVKL